MSCPYLRLIFTYFRLKKCFFYIFCTIHCRVVELELKGSYYELYMWCKHSFFYYHNATWLITTIYNVHIQNYLRCSWQSFFLFNKKCVKTENICSDFYSPNHRLISFRCVHCARHDFNPNQLISCTTCEIYVAKRYTIVHWLILF